MDYHKFIVSNQKEESISIQRVKHNNKLDIFCQYYTCNLLIFGNEISSDISVTHHHLRQKEMFYFINNYNSGMIFRWFVLCQDLSSLLNFDGYMHF